MIPLPFLAGKAVAVMGLGVAGLATARALAASEAKVMAWDDTPESRTRAEREGLPLVDLARADWAGIELLVLSPGIPHSFPIPHPVAARAREAGVPIVCDIDLLGRAQATGDGRARLLGITGTNGKSTTTALVAHVLGSADRTIEFGGNLGPPVLAMRPLGPDGCYVLELSSYQLERTESVAWDVGVLLNISPDHLDRHGGMAGYVAAKARMFATQADGAVAVIGIDDEDSRALANRLVTEGRLQVRRISGRRIEPGILGVEDDNLVDWTGGGSKRTILPLDDLHRLRGSHNRQNVAAAFAACRALGLGDDEIVAAVRSFRGLPHRQELVASIGPIVFVNDSKATNQDAAATALSSFERIYWIAGGQPKEGGYGAIDPYLDRIAHAFLIGAAAEAIANHLGDRVPHTIAGTLDRAVSAAVDMAARDPVPDEKVILLAPACASFDQFANFGERGDAFRALAEQCVADRLRGAA